MNVIDIFPWNANFATGIASIDEQHERLVVLVNELAGHIVFRTGQTDPNALIAGLADYAVYHFATEEAVWHTYLPDDALELGHLEVHRQFVTKVQALQAGVSTATDAMLADALSFLTSWLIAHILQSDRHLAMVVQAIQSGKTIAEAKAHAQGKFSDGTQAIINIILSLYSKFSANAVRLMQEVAARQDSARALIESQSQLKGIIDSTDDLIWSVSVDSRRLTMFNQGFAGFVKRTRGKEAQIGLHSADIFVSDDVAGLLETFYERVLAEGPVFIDECDLGRGRGYALALHPLEHDKSTYGISVFARDITEQKLALESIHQLAYFDALTALPNRRLLLDRLRQEVSFSDRRGTYSALLFIDLDNFKVLNDTRGHQVGDELLVEVAHRLRKSVRESDTVARLGGDEFVILTCDIGKTLDEAIGHIEVVGLKVLNSLRDEFMVGQESYRTTASIGAYPFNSEVTSVEELLKRADTAMYQAKGSGRNALCFFDPKMQSILEARVRIESWMRASIGEHFQLHYQPQVDSTGRVIGAEALLRWQHPEQGYISPATFIPLAEETGLILQIGEWVLREACSQLKQWNNDSRTSHMTIAVNVSAKQFKQADFVDLVLNTVGSTGASASRLKLELTESMLVSNVDETALKMATLKGAGITFSLDDFGTGYSSLSVLKRLPFDQLKIDQSFVRDMLTDQSDAAIAQTIVALGKSLGIAVIAEGVETDAHMEHLLAMDCHAFQGFLFGRPMTAPALMEWLDNSAR